MIMSNTLRDYLKLYVQISNNCWYLSTKLKKPLMAEYVKTLYVGLGVDANIFNGILPLETCGWWPYEENIPEVEKFIAPILASDALLFIIPEYNEFFGI